MIINKTLKENKFYEIIDTVVPGLCKDDLIDPEYRSTVFFERISMDGLHEMYEYSKDPNMYKYLSSSPPKSIEDTKNTLAHFIDQVGNDVYGRKRMMWFVRRFVDRRVIGTVSILNIDYKSSMTDWSFALGSAYWGSGYSFEMLELVKKYVFDDLGINRIYGCTRIENISVINLLLSLGAENEGIAREVYSDGNGMYFDGWMYSILAKDYYSVRKKQSYRASESEISKEYIAVIVSSALDGISISIDDSMQSVSSWDSFNHIEIILLLQEKTGYKFSPIEISHSTSINSIFKVINKK